MKKLRKKYTVMHKFLKRTIIAIAGICTVLLSGCTITIEEISQIPESATVELDQIPEYSGEPYIAIHGNEPYFEESDYTEESYEAYGELDALGRCTTVIANIGTELMPTQKRGEIGSVRPTGWHTLKFDFVDGRYLYNRCHLIGHQLTAEDANEKNLITGTRYMNVEGMLPFENMVTDYIKETNNHVLYRVTPVFEGDDLVAKGVVMEARSIEDEGDGICYNVFVYNVQPGVEIDYATGEAKEEIASGSGERGTWILNTNTKKYHLPSCSGANAMKPENRQEYKGDKYKLEQGGFKPCNTCNP